MQTTLCFLRFRFSTFKITPPSSWLCERNTFVATIVIQTEFQWITILLPNKNLFIRGLHRENFFVIIVFDWLGRKLCYSPTPNSKPQVYQLAHHAYEVKQAIFETHSSPNLGNPSCNPSPKTSFPPRFPLICWTNKSLWHETLCLHGNSSSYRSPMPT